MNTAKGLLVAYRDHTPQDILDIGILRFENGRWSSSKILHPDKWRINACPVNAGAAAAKDSRVAIAWYRAADYMPGFRLPSHRMRGTRSASLRRLSRDTIGYASTALTGDGGAIVSWIEEGANSVRALVRAVSPAGAAGPVIQIAEGSRTNLGYPKLGHSGNETWIAWGDSKTGVKTAQLK